MATIDIGFDVFLGTWTSAKTYLRNADTVSITRGRQDLKSTLSPATATMTLDNRDSRWTIRNPSGPWYGQLVQNSPVRFSVPSSLAGLPCYLRTETDTASYASCPDTAGLQVTTGTLSVRIDCLITDWSGNHVLIAKNGVTAQAWALWTNPDGTLEFAHWDSGAVRRDAPSTLPLPYFGSRIAIRVDYNITAQTVTYYTAPTMSGSWTQLGTTTSTSATTQAAGTGQVIQVAGGTTGTVGLPGLYGNVYEAQIYNGVTLEADPVFTSQTPGASSFTDGQSNTWTLAGTAELSGRLYRFHGELAAVPKAADPSGRNVYSQAQAGGILRRLQQQQSPANSAMYRACVRIQGPTAPVAYWSCEDMAGAVQLLSGIGGPAMTFLGPVTLASFSGFASSAPLPVLNGGTLSGTVTDPGGTANVIRFLLAVPAGGDTNGGVIARIYTQGTVARFDLVYGTGGTLNLFGFDPSGNQLFSTGAFLFNVNGALLRASIEIVQSGGNITYNIVTVAPNALIGQVSGPATLTSATVGPVTQVQFNPGGLLTGTAVGHITIADANDSVFSLGPPLGAWLGETAGNRVSRLCTEEGISSRIIGPVQASQPMGTQTLQTIPALLQECENTDQGMLFEPRQVLGIGYVTNQALGQQPVTATADFSAAQVDTPFSPVSDDTQVVNDVTMTATDGSSARQFLATGPMSIQSPPSGVGRFDTAVSVNPQSGSGLVLPSLANWYLHVLSANEDRYPSIPFQMARGTQPNTIPLLDIGSYIQMINVPSWVPPGPVKQLCAGFTEVIGPQPLWSIAVNGIPEVPYETGIVMDPVYGRADTDGSALTFAATSGATTLYVSTTNTAMPTWTLAGGDFPFDVMASGEQMTVTAITGGPPAQVQSASNSNTGSATLTVTLPGGTTAGNCVLVLISASGTTTNPTITGVTLGGAAGNFASVLSVANTEAQLGFWADPNCAGGQTAVAVTTTGGSGTIAITAYAIEFSGVAVVTPLDKTGNNGATSAFSTWNTGGTGTLTQSAEIIAALVTGVSATGGITVTGPGGPWVNLPQVTQADGTNNCYSLAGYQLAQSTAQGLYAGSFSAAAPYMGGIVSLLAAQQFTVTRAVNGIHKAQTAGTDVRLAHPMIVSL